MINDLNINKKNKGILFICATPIGNLEDVSFRLIRTLKEADIIAAEDTRTIKKLLLRYDIKNSNIISYHDYSKKNRINYILKKLKEGKNIALVSESGTPLIQDPGYRIITLCIEKKIPLSIIPGPSAAISALVLSGLPTDCFLFAGFLPKTKSKRIRKLKELSLIPYTVIFYESPKRVQNLLAEIKEVMGDRKACLARELTKVYEEVIRGNVTKILAKLEERTIKGEIVIIVEGFKGELIKNFTEEDIREEITNLLSQGISKKNALKVISQRYDIDRQTLYNISTKI